MVTIIFKLMGVLFFGGLYTLTAWWFLGDFARVLLVGFIFTSVLILWAEAKSALSGRAR